MKVAVLKTSPGTVLDDYSKVMHLAEYKKTLRQKEAIVKLNLSWSKYYPACSSQPWQLEGVIRTMNNYKLHPVEHRTVVTDVMQGAIENKWLPVLKKYNLKYEPLTEKKWVKYKPKSEMLALDRIIPHHKIPEMFIGSNIVHLPTMKTHGHTTMTGAMKNAFGGLITERRHHCHKHIHEVLVDLLSIQKEIHPGIFAVMDGTVAGDGLGPRTMIPRIKNFVLAGADQVAVDSISAKMMGFDPMKIKFIKLAHDLGLGCGDINQIDLVGDDISKQNFKFRTGRSPVIYFDQMLRNGALSFVEPLLFHTGLFRACIFGSAFYHDKLWYNTIGRSRIKQFNKTPWGRLFRKY